MENTQRNNREKSFKVMRMVYDITMGLLMLSLGVAMVLADRWGFAQVLDWGKGMRYFFGFILLLYGGFRIYRGVKQVQ